MSNLTLIIGNKNYSSWSLRPWIFMKQMNIAFNEKRIPLFTESTEKELLPYFSNYKVPVLLDGDTIIWDSLAILEYLAENFLHSAGWPRDPVARGVARSVSAEMHSSFFALRNELPMNCRKKTTEFRLSDDVMTDVRRIEEIWNMCRKEYGGGGEWLFGEYSIADAIYSPVVLRFDSYGVPLQSEVGKSYVRHYLENPYMKEWIESGKSEKEIIEMSEV